jgi:hypothetical protein
VVVDIDPSDDSPRVLLIGPDQAGNLLEVVVLKSADGRLVAIHAMPLRRAYHGLLGEGTDG